MQPPGGSPAKQLRASRGERVSLAVRPVLTSVRGALFPARPGEAKRRAAGLLAAALAEGEPARRIGRLRLALAAGEALADASGDVVVIEYVPSRSKAIRPQSRLFGKEGQRRGVGFSTAVYSQQR